jgi:hypothetical protein
MQSPLMLLAVTAVATRAEGPWRRCYMRPPPLLQTSSVFATWTPLLLQGPWRRCYLRPPPLLPSAVVIATRAMALMLPAATTVATCICRRCYEGHGTDATCGHRRCYLRRPLATAGAASERRDSSSSPARASSPMAACVSLEDVDAQLLQTKGRGVCGLGTRFHGRPPGFRAELRWRMPGSGPS